MSGHDSRGGRKPLTHIEARTSHLVAHLGKSTESLLSPKKGDPDREVPPNEKMGRLPKALIAAGYAKAWQLVEADESALAEILYLTGEPIGEQGVAKIRSVLTAVRLSFRPLSEKLRTQLSKENPRRKAPKKKKGRTHPLDRSTPPPPPAPQEPAMTSPDPNTITLETLFPNKEGIDRTTPSLRKALAAAGFVNARSLYEASKEDLQGISVGKNRRIGPVFLRQIDEALAAHGLVRSEPAAEGVKLKKPKAVRAPTPRLSTSGDEEDLPPEAGEELPPRAPLCGGLCHLPSKADLAAQFGIAQSNLATAAQRKRTAENDVHDLRARLTAAEQELTDADHAEREASRAAERLAFLLNNRDEIEEGLQIGSAIKPLSTPTP